MAAASIWASPIRRGGCGRTRATPPACARRCSGCSTRACSTAAPSGICSSPATARAARIAAIAAARAGNADFAAAYAATRIACLRYELPHDLVPHLPPGPRTPDWIRALVHPLAPNLAAFDYHPVGLKVSGHAPRHQPWANSRRRLPRLFDRRGLSLSALMPSMLAAHAICPDSGYDRLVCTGEGCAHGG